MMAGPIDCDEMPEDAERLRQIVLDLPRLSDDAAASSPVALAEVLDYLALEAPGGTSLEPIDLNFERTVDLGDVSYWVWAFTEPATSEAAYVFVRLEAGQGIVGDEAVDRVTVGYEANFHELSPEQFIVGHYCGHW